MYALLGLGLVATYRGSGVLNFAQGSLAMSAAFAFNDLRSHATGLPVPVDFLLSIALSGALAVLIDTLLIQRIRHRSQLVQMAGTLAAGIVIQAAILLRYGSTTVIVAGLLPERTFQMAGTSVSSDRLLLGGIAVVLTVGVSLVYAKTRFGVLTSAAAENSELLECVGTSSSRVSRINWGVGGVLAGTAGIFLTPILGLGVTPLSLLVIEALAAALLGGLSSFGFCLLGGLVIGISEAEAASYIHVVGAQTAAPLLLVALVMFIRGRAIPVRGFVAAQLPAVGVGRRFVGTWCAIGSLLLLSVWTWLPIDWVGPITITGIFVVLAFSLVVLSGYAGMASLCQVAFAGLAGVLAVDFMRDTKMTFLLAALCAVLSVAVVGGLIGLPSIRMRGQSLAIVTLCVAGAADVLIFQNAANATIPPLTVFGIGVNSITEPKRYATLVIICVVLAAAVVVTVRRSQFGRKLLAIRGNEIAAASMGINVGWSKLKIFALSAGLSGAAGVLLVCLYPTIDVSNGYGALDSVNVLGWGIIGGIGYVGGGIVAALFPVGGLGSRVGDIFSADVQRWLPLISGCLLILTVLFNPDGVAEGLSRQLLWLKQLPRKVLQRTSPPERSQLWRRTVRTTTVEHEFINARPPARGEQRQELSVTNLSVSFGGVTALDQVTLTVPPGRVVGVIGPNGAGKTTLVDVISGVTRPTTGSVRLGPDILDGQSIHARARAGISRSFQGVEVFPGMTVEENLSLVKDSRSARLLLRSNEMSSWARLLSNRLGLQPYLASQVSELPLGLQKVLGVARAMTLGGDTLLLDEPASGLDEQEVHDLAETIRWIAGLGVGVLLVEHNLPLVNLVCHEVVLLVSGRITSTGSPAEVMSDETAMIAYLGEHSAAKERTVVTQRGRN